MVKSSGLYIEIPVFSGISYPTVARLNPVTVTSP